MFNAVEYVRDVCHQRGISISTLEKELGFANGYLNPKKLSKLSYERAVKISNYLGISLEYLLTGEEKEGGETYYLNEETSKMAQSIFENKELRLLFDAARDADPEDLEAVHSMLLALKRKERGNID